MTIEITEADREAAVLILRHLNEKGVVNSVADAEWIRQLFAKHRFAAIQAREEETAWLIERHDYTPGLHYYAEYPNGDHYWTPDHLKAMRFATEADARVIAKDDPLLTAVEHMWVANPQAREDGGKSAEAVEQAAEMIWHRFAPPTQIEWQDEREKAPYRDCARGILSLYTHPTPAELPGDALRATFKLAASQIERDVRLSELTDEEIDALAQAVRG